MNLVQHEQEATGPLRVYPDSKHGLNAADAGIANDAILLLSRFARKRDASAFAHRAVPPVAADEVASLYLLTLARAQHRGHNPCLVLTETDKLTIQFHLYSVRFQLFAQNNLGVLLTDLDGSMRDPGVCQQSHVRCHIVLAQQLILAVIQAIGPPGFDVGSKTLIGTNMFQNILGWR